MIMDAYRCPEETTAFNFNMGLHIHGCDSCNTVCRAIWEHCTWSCTTPFPGNNVGAWLVQ